MKRTELDSAYSAEKRMPYDSRKNPCTKDCARRKAECARTCPDWTVYASGRVKRYEYNKMVFDTMETLRTPVSRDKRGQI